MRAFDVVVIGAGHAGIEAALVASRMGCNTACITLRLDRIGHLPCNCSVGGPAKGHIAREVDALGGQMGVTTDHTLTHLRMVGTGKGPAVQTVRAQVCKTDYPLFMQKVMAEQKNLTLIESQVETVLTESGQVSGVLVRYNDGTTEEIACRAAVITTGTFMNGLCHEGSNKTIAAREGDRAVVGLSDFLKSIGVNIRRFKTGTTPRIKLSSIDFSQTEVMPSEREAGPLSFLHDDVMPKRDLLPTWQTHTNSEAHQILRDNLHRSAMYGGMIEGVGPRYCPSIEDKVVRFAEKDSHPIFLEQEEWDSESVYVQGFSSSMPAEVQLEALRKIHGLENVEMIRPGYAVEYDMADPLQLGPTLMSKLLRGLFLAGQINGTSGYEEAAGQGIVAGINAAQLVRNQPEVVFPRSGSFIGVMIDDLVTKGVEDPYRMLTARAEHRLLLRHDNADQRLTPLGVKLGLVDQSRKDRFDEKMRMLANTRAFMEATHFFEAFNPTLDRFEITSIKNKVSTWDLLKRPHVTLDVLVPAGEACGLDMSGIPDAGCLPGSLDETVRQQLEIQAVYDGYLKRQEEEALIAEKMEELAIPPDFDYNIVRGISFESLEKLQRVRPTTVGQASRIPGVRPTDVAMLIGWVRGTARAYATKTKS